jgi:hypothetical protein
VFECKSARFVAEVDDAVELRPVRARDTRSAREVPDGLNECRTWTRRDLDGASATDDCVRHWSDDAHASSATSRRPRAQRRFAGSGPSFPAFQHSSPRIDGVASPRAGSPTHRSTMVGSDSRCRVNTEGTPARARAGTCGHSSADDSFLLRGFRARGFPALPAVFRFVARW